MLETDILPKPDPGIAKTPNRILVFVCKTHILPRSICPNASRVLGDVAHDCVHESTYPSILGQIFPKSDKHEDDYVILDLIETENITTIIDAGLGSDVWDGLIFGQKKSTRWVSVRSLMNVLNDFVDLIQDRHHGFQSPTGVDVAESTRKVELAG